MVVTDIKIPFVFMPGAEWLALLCEHIPDRYEHLVLYVGWYSNRSRGARTAKAPAPVCESATESISEIVQGAKQA